MKQTINPPIARTSLSELQAIIAPIRVMTRLIRKITPASPSTLNRAGEVDNGIEGLICFFPQVVEEDQK